MIIRLIPTAELDSILPLIQILNPTLTLEVLTSRLNDMKSQQYRCVGVFDAERLIAVAGLWMSTRFYCGRLIEPDNVVIDPQYRSRGIGRILTDWICNYAREQGCEALELCAYTTNDRAHKFWFKEGFKILGFRFRRPLN